jgi:D-glycero-beta-D-manno-heptose 1-phosphate adenylyltransferase
MESYLAKVMTLAQAKEACARVRASGGRVVFTNGCFDLLHPGHIRYLFAARQLGDHLIVAVNSDRSVQSIKGPERPICSEQVRLEMLAALGCVDSVILFGEDNPLAVIQVLVPDILVKGGDWSEADIIGADVVASAGGTVKTIPFVEGFSTTRLIQEIALRACPKPS